MGEIADRHVDMYSSGVWGIPIGRKLNFPRTSKEEIKNSIFFIAEVVGFNTNRVRGTKLIVCEQNEDTYWVWTSKGVTGIRKEVCRVISEGMSIEQAKTTRKQLSNQTVKEKK